MENIHIRLNYGEAVFAKRELLIAQMNTLKALRAFKNFRELRKKQNETRDNFRNSLAGFKKAVDEFEKTLPSKQEQEEQQKILDQISKKPKIDKIEEKKRPEKPKHFEFKKIIIPKKESLDPIGDELLEIKKKLARLG